MSNNIFAGVFVLFLMRSSNRSIKLGYYLLQFYMNKMLFHDLTNKEVVWMWNISHIHSYQHRKTLSELDIIVGRLVHNSYQHTQSQMCTQCNIFTCVITYLYVNRLSLVGYYVYLHVFSTTQISR